MGRSQRPICLVFTLPAQAVLGIGERIFVMKVRLLTIGQKMPDWVQTGYDDYARRVQPMLPVHTLELPMARRGKSDSPADIQKYCQQEGQAILAALQPRERLIALEVGGRNLSTEKLSSTLETWMLEGVDVALAIGGPDGLSDAVRQRAEWHWSLSALTLPHPMVRVIVIEQLYRAMSLMKGHPYHRA
jgi:23S rRNA (pseudouridine1915-N3)-methyltransferase